MPSSRTATRESPHTAGCRWVQDHPMRPIPCGKDRVALSGFVWPEERAARHSLPPYSAWPLLRSSYNVRLHVGSGHVKKIMSDMKIWIAQHRISFTVRIAFLP